MRTFIQMLKYVGSNWKHRNDYSKSKLMIDHSLFHYTANIPIHSFPNLDIPNCVNHQESFVLLHISWKKMKFSLVPWFEFPCWVGWGGEGVASSGAAGRGMLGRNCPFQLVAGEINYPAQMTATQTKKRETELQKRGSRDFPGGPEVKNPPYNAWDMGSIPAWGTKIPHATPLATKPLNHNCRAQVPQRRSLMLWLRPEAAKNKQ